MSTMRKIIILLFFSNYLSLSISAQVDHERCAYDQLKEQHISQFPEMENRLKEIEREIQTTRPTIANQRSVITIPVVVHVLYYDESENIPDLQIYSQIEVLNEDFRLLNENVRSIPGEFEPFAIDTEIEFCLASVDAQNLPTTGINRVQTPFECIADIGSVKENGIPRLFYSNLGGTDAWDPEHYLNIWVGNTCLYALGVAPNIALQDFMPEQDGIVIDLAAFGNNCGSSIAAPYHLGRTATHEVGHYLNLLHPWGECADGDADNVLDTPMQEKPHLGCPVYPSISCGNSDMYMNFMNYADDACLAMFTQGQKDRMLATLNGPRAGLLESVGCAYLEPVVPFDQDAFTLYPNPATNCIHIDFNADIPGDVDVEMVNASGQVVYRNLESSRNFRSIDAANLANGIYFVSFRAAKQTFTKKVMIMK